MRGSGYNPRFLDALDLAMSDSHHPIEHSSPIKTPKQLIIAVVLSFIVPVLVIVMLAQIAVGGKKAPAGADAAAAEEAVAKRLKPAGTVVVVDANAPLQLRDGKTVTEAACAACHFTGALNAPKIGDKAAWGKLSGRGLDALTASAIKGVRQMPARGGNPDIPDVEIARAIAYMVNQSGGNMKEPAAPAPSATPAVAAVTTAAVPVTVAAAAPAAGGDAARGKSVYDSSCAACHSAGVAGAPKTGDKTAWGPRLKSGKDALYASVLKGKGAMPAKGGNASLTEADVKASVDYMLSLVK
jgi:cytochrome c5